MKILLDHNLDIAIKRHIPNHDVYTCKDLGWEGLQNGKLLSTARNNGVSLLIACDKNIRFQTNLAKLPLPVLELPFQQFTKLEPIWKAILEQINATSQVSGFRIMDADGNLIDPKRQKR